MDIKKNKSKTTTKTRLKNTPFSIINATGEINNKPSLAIPDESYTIRELLEKHARGIMPPVGLSPQYDHEEPTFDDDVTLRKPDLDLTDIDNIKSKIAKVQKTQKASSADRSSTAQGEAPAVQRSGTATSAARGIEETSHGDEGTKTKNEPSK